MYLLPVECNELPGFQVHCPPMFESQSTHARKVPCNFELLMTFARTKEHSISKFTLLDNRSPDSENLGRQKISSHRCVSKVHVVDQGW